MTSALPARPRTRKPADDRRREIADAALRVIAAQGLGRFTAAALAADVGVTDGALFRHFRTKEAIVLAAIERVEELLSEGPAPAGADPVARLGAFFERRVRVLREHAGISRLLVSDELAHAAPPEGVERIAALRRRSVSFVRACLEDASSRGVLAPGLRPDDAAVVVIGAILAVGHGAAQPAVDGAAAGRVWAALETFLRGPGEARREETGRRPPPPSGRSSRRRKS